MLGKYTRSIERTYVLHQHLQGSYSLLLWKNINWARAFMDPTHRIHGTGIFTYIYHNFQPNICKYTSHMDPMGYGKVHMSCCYTLRIQICPKKGISPTILFWGWDWDHQTYSREGSGFLGTMFYGVVTWTSTANPVTDFYSCEKETARWAPSRSLQVEL